MAHGGRRNGSGRPRGSENKVTSDVREILNEVFQELGGTKAMIEWAKNREDDFRLKLWSKLIPTTASVKADVGVGYTCYEDLLFETLRNMDAPKDEEKE